MALVGDDSHGGPGVLGPEVGFTSFRDFRCSHCGPGVLSSGVPGKWWSRNSTAGVGAPSLRLWAMPRGAQREIPGNPVRLLRERWVFPVVVELPVPAAG